MFFTAIGGSITTAITTESPAVAVVLHRTAFLQITGCMLQVTVYVHCGKDGLEVVMNKQYQYKSNVRKKNTKLPKSTLLLLDKYGYKVEDATFAGVVKGLAIVFEEN